MQTVRSRGQSRQVLICNQPETGQEQWKFKPEAAFAHRQPSRASSLTLAAKIAVSTRSTSPRVRKRGNSRPRQASRPHPPFTMAPSISAHGTAHSMHSTRRPAHYAGRVSLADPSSHPQLSPTGMSTSVRSIRSSTPSTPTPAHQNGSSIRVATSNHHHSWQKTLFMWAPSTSTSTRWMHRMVS